MKLTNTQLLLLSRGSQRNDCGITIPDTLKGAAALRVIGKLLDTGLIEEVPTVGDLPVWRRDANNASSSLVITAAGLQAIGIDSVQAEGNDASFSRTEFQHKITQRRRSQRTERSATDGPSTRGNHAPSAPNPQKADGAKPGLLATPRASSKMAQLIGLLQRAKGAGVDDLAATFGWLPHSSRAALTGLRKRGFVIERQRLKDGSTIYRIAAEPPAINSAVRRKSTESSKRPPRARNSKDDRGR